MTDAASWPQTGAVQAVGALYTIFDKLDTVESWGSLSGRRHQEIEELIRAALAPSPCQTLLVTELFALAEAAGFSRADVEPALVVFEETGQIVVLRHPVTDPHLQMADLRTVSLLETQSPDAYADARRNAQKHWDDFMRNYLSTHRCG